MITSATRIEPPQQGERNTSRVNVLTSSVAHSIRLVSFVELDTTADEAGARNGALPDGAAVDGVVVWNGVPRCDEVQDVAVIPSTSRQCNEDVRATRLE